MTRVMVMNIDWC